MSKPLSAARWYGLARKIKRRRARAAGKCACGREPRPGWQTCAACYGYIVKFRESMKQDVGK